MTFHSHPLGNNLSVSGKTWTLREADWRKTVSLAQKHSLPETVARLLVTRGIPDHQISHFLNPTLRETLSDPFHLKDMEKAVLRTLTAIKTKEKIALFGDYDVDGATSTALLTRFLRSIDQTVRVYIPDRLQEGYGPTPHAFDQLKREDCSLVFTLDCGTTAFTALEHAQLMGLDVIVLDHHLCESQLPPAIALVNPNRLDENSPYKYCAAVGITFLFVIALNQRLKAQGFYGTSPGPDLLEFLDLVAMGTVCDVVPLEGINRAFVKQGIKVMAKRNNIGLRALADHAQLSQMPTTYHLGFVLGPRINAGGRVGQADLGSRLLSTHNECEAAEISGQLSQYNKERQEIETIVLTQALQQAESQSHPFIVTTDRDWHPGVIGIVAGRLKERFNRPSCAISLDEAGIGKGSVRSIQGVDFGNLIQQAKHMGFLLGGGGHAMAGGFTILQEKIPDFQNFINEELLKSRLDLTPKLSIDAPLSLRAANVDFLKHLELLAPYGQGNPTPRFLFDALTVVKVDIVGQDHLRCILKSFEGQSLSAMAFRAVGNPLGKALLTAKNQAIQLVGTLKLDQWQGLEKVTLMIEDLAFKAA